MSLQYSPSDTWNLTIIRRTAPTRLGLIWDLPIPETEQEVQGGLVVVLSLFLIGRMFLAFVSAPWHDRLRQVVIVMALPALLVLFTSWDLFWENPL